MTKHSLKTGAPPALGMKVRTVVAVLTACASLSAAAQTYPVKPVRMIVTVGGNADIFARWVGQKLTETLGQPVVVEAMPGAGGAIGAETTARAAGDGHTIMLATPGTQVMRVFLTKSMSYDQIRDFTPIGQVAETATVLTASASLPVSSLQELIAYAKANPGKLSYASSGVGTSHHMAGEELKQVSGIDIVHVPYKSGAQALQDVIGGQIPLSFSVLAQVAPNMKSGKLKILAMVNDTRHGSIPDVPSMREVVQGFQSPPYWMAYFGPAGMPPAVVKRLHGEIGKSLEPQDVRTKFDAMGFTVRTGTPEELAAKVKSDMSLAERIVKSAKIQPE